MSVSSITKTFGDYVYEFYVDSENPEFYHAIIISKLHDRTIRSLNIGGIRNVPVGHFDVSENGSNFIVLKLQPEIGPKYYCYILAVVDGRIRAHEKDTRSAFPNKTFARFSALGHFREVEYLTCKLSGPRLTRSDVVDTVRKSLKSLPYHDIVSYSYPTRVVKSTGNGRCTFVVGLLLKTKHGEIYSKVGVVDKHGILRWVCEGTPWVDKDSYIQDNGVKEGSLDHIHVVYHENTRVVSFVKEGRESVNLKFDQFYSSMTLENNAIEHTLMPMLLSVESGGQPTITDKQQFDINLKTKLNNTGAALERLLTIRQAELTEEILQLQKKIEEYQKVLRSFETELQDIQNLQQTRQQSLQLNQSTST